MKASDAIKELQRLIDKHGDFMLVRHEDEYDYWYELKWCDIVNLDEEKDTLHVTKSVLEYDGLYGTIF